MKKNKNKSDFVLWARQYSKQFLTALLVMWAIGAVIGAIYEFIRLHVAPDTASMDAFYIYLAVPLTCGIPSYIVPNIFLNREKVRMNYIPNYDEVYLGGGGDEDEIIPDETAEETGRGIPPEYGEDDNEEQEDTD